MFNTVNMHAVRQICEQTLLTSKHRLNLHKLVLKHTRRFHRSTCKTSSIVSKTKLTNIDTKLNDRHYLFSASNSYQKRLKSSQASTDLTVDEEEIVKFEKMSQQWWNENGEFGALHSMNKLRVPLIRDGILGVNVIANEGMVQKSQPLEGVSIVDVGCGGGILCEPLARLGANVLGLDAGEENINIAKIHLKQDPALSERLTYICSTVEDLAITDEGRHDVVVASEVIEHVKEPLTFISACCSLLKPGGSIFLTTINKTALSYSLAVFAAEQILGLVPAGTHDWNKFISPDNLQFLLHQSDCSTRLVHGMTLNPLTNQWQWISSTSINYAIHAVKQKPHPETSSSSSDSS